MKGRPVNDKVYIHEFIDIIGHNRANCMHHMTAAGIRAEVFAHEQITVPPRPLGRVSR